MCTGLFLVTGAMESSPYELSRKFKIFRNLRDIKIMRKNYCKLYSKQMVALCRAPLSVRYQSTAYCLDDDKLEKFLRNINTEYLNSKFNISKDPFIFNLVQDKNKLEETLKQLESMKGSGGKEEKEMLHLIEDDIRQHKIELKEVYEQMIDYLIPREDFEDCNDIVIEISSGVGGSEAMLFASDLRNMYCGYLDYKGWHYFVAENAESDLGM
uniref:Peptide chain release factor domain-containing protein n=1 Tax=Graphocephala atropunctata TaxID=36148 RepID=A0A1B6LYV6_9HEMI